MIILMKGLNEEFCVDRVMHNIHNEPFVDRIIVIDGGSTDYTVHELCKWEKCEVFVHPWLNWYHDMEVAQSNIALSYVPNGQICFILDFDERVTDELKKVLLDINNDGLPGGVDIAHVSRRTVEVIRYPNSPYATFGNDGWPIASHQIGQYPDYQCRIIEKRPKHHWVNSPHHVLLGFSNNVNFDADIIHYEKDDFRCRLRVEKQWARAQAVRTKLGLPVDRFECRPSPENHKYTVPEYWEK